MQQNRASPEWRKQASSGYAGLSSRTIFSKGIAASQTMMASRALCLRSRLWLLSDCKKKLLASVG